MRTDRRRLLRLAGAGIVAAASPYAFPRSLLAAPKKGGPPAALLLPLSGPSAGIGRSMERAGALAQPPDAKRDALIVLDSEGDPAAAALQAIERGAPMILGPLFTGQVRAVVAAVADRVPVLTFSNDASLRGSGAFVFGITPGQSAVAILRYARGRGIRTVVVLAGADPWGTQAGTAATMAAGELDLSIRVAPGGAGISPESIRDSAGELPDAVLITQGGSAIAPLARGLIASGVQPLATLQMLDPALPAVDGLWLSAPDPSGFGDFQRAYETRYGGTPGSVAGLAFDAVTFARSLLASGRVDRAAVLAAAGYPGITGAFRFAPDGGCSREMAILQGQAGRYAVVGSSVGG